jgi:hypothetical protein
MFTLRKRNIENPHFATTEGFISLWQLLESCLTGRELTHLDNQRPNLHNDSLIKPIDAMCNRFAFLGPPTLCHIFIDNIKLQPNILRLIESVVCLDPREVIYGKESAK